MAVFPSAPITTMKALVPDLAIIPRLFNVQFLVLSTPVSSILMVELVFSGITLTFGRASISSGLTPNLSKASEKFELNSRMEVSMLEKVPMIKPTLDVYIGGNGLQHGYRKPDTTKRSGEHKICSTEYAEITENWTWIQATIQHQNHKIIFEKHIENMRKKILFLP